MGNDEQEDSSNSGHVHVFNRVLGVEGDINAPDAEKKVVYGCAGCDAREVQ